MGTTIKARLLDYISSIGISVREFERSIELSNGYINNLGESPGMKVINRIIDKNPNLSRIWLLTGEGEMLVNSVVGDGNSNNNNTHNTNNMSGGIIIGDNYTGNINTNKNNELSAEKIKHLENIIKEKDALLEEKERMIKVLMQINNLTK